MGFSLKEYMQNKQSGNIQAPVIKQTGKGFSLKDYINSVPVSVNTAAQVAPTQSYKSIVPTPAPTAYQPSDDDLMAQLNSQPPVVTRTREDLTAERDRLENELRNYSDYGTGAQMSDDEIMAKTNRLDALRNTNMEMVPKAINRGADVKREWKKLAYANISNKKDYAQYSKPVADNKSGLLGLGTDWKYRYINNINNYREKLDLNGENSDNEIKQYSVLKPDEIGTYNYIYAKEGQKSAEKYLGTLQEDLNYRHGENTYKAIEGKPALEVPYGVIAGADQFISGTSQLFQKDARVTTPTQYASQMVREDLQKVGPEILGSSLGQLGYDLVTTAANMAPSILLSTVTGGALATAGVSSGTASLAAKLAGTVAMGASVTGNAYNQKRKEGYSEKQAKIYALLIGASESSLQYLIGGFSALGGVSGTQLAQKIALIDNALLRASASVGSNMLGEATEEGLQEVLDTVFSNLVLKTDLKPNFENVAYAALMGALSSGVIEGTTQISEAKAKPQQAAQDSRTTPVLSPPEGDQAQGVQVPALQTNSLQNASVENIYKAATPAQQSLNATLKEIADGLGIKQIDSQQKSIESIQSKLKRKNDAGLKYSVLDMKDHARGALALNNWDQVPKVLDLLGKKNIPYETEAVGPTDWGYKGFHVTFRGSDGIGSEIQLTRSGVWETKLKSDAIYDYWREKDYASLSTEEKLKYMADKNRSLAMWNQLVLPDFTVYERSSSSDSTRALNISSQYSGEEAGTHLPSTSSFTSTEDVSNTRPDSVTQAIHSAPSNSFNNIIHPKEGKYNTPMQKNGVAVVERQKSPTLRDIVDTKVNEQGLEPIKPLKTQHEGDSKSKFAESIQSADILDEQFKKVALDNQNIQSYDRISNKETMSEANNLINEGGQKYVDRWKEKWKDAKSQKVTPTDIAAGLILMHRYQTVGDYESMIGIAERLRGMGTKAGQAVQAFSILGRMTPEGMVKYAGAELANATEALRDQKLNKWVDKVQGKYKDAFTLTPEDVKFITEHAQKAAELPDGRDKNIILAQVSTRIQNKIPPLFRTSLKALARNSMLLNPRTMVRNVLGNLSIAPVHIGADVVSAGVDRIISKKTGVREVGTFQPSSIKSAGKGLYESYSDFINKVNTRNMDGNRFEIGNGPSFNPNSKMGQALNAVDRITSFLLDAGDRPFYEMWFTNSLNNQVKLNHVEAATPEMIEIATQEALERTWQDSNSTTDAVKWLQTGLNRLTGNKEFGLGTIILPFVKTPANLARATVQFSPLGYLQLLGSESRAFTYAMKKGTVTPGMQRAYAQIIGKATAGTVLTIAGAALKAAGAIRGGNDEDKDVSAYEQNILGIKPYSVITKAGSFSYDWMQPIATNLAVVADMMKNVANGKTPTWGDAGTAVKGVLGNMQQALEMGGNTLYNQTLFRGIGEIFKSDSVVQGLISSALSLPSQLAPALFGQVARVADNTERATFENGDIVGSTFNEIKSKIPGARNTLAPRVDVLGREVKSNNNPANVFLNPANSGVSNPSDAGAEAYRVYQATGDKGVIPREVAYSYKSDGESIKLSSKERAELQKIMGQASEQAINDLMAKNAYKTMLDEDKAEVLKDIYTYAEAKAKNEIGIAYSDTLKKVSMAEDKGISPADYYLVGALANTDGNSSVNQEELEAYLKKQKSLSIEQKAYIWALENKTSPPSSNPYKHGYKIPGYTKR